MSREIQIRRIDGTYLVDFGNVRFSASGWDLLRLRETIGFAVLDEDRAPGGSPEKLTAEGKDRG